VIKTVVTKFLLSVAALLFCYGVWAQEVTGALQWRHMPPRAVKPATAAKTTALTQLSLPFFEDFTNYTPYPDAARWVDSEAYVNNTMGKSPVSRGVATLDVLDRDGLPYDPYATEGYRYCDSLTSQPINLGLGTVSPADSIYLSFFYQPQGNGFYPLIQDSLVLFFKTKYGGWQQVWKVEGSSSLPFQQAMVPVTDSLYFSDSFQFRFVNIGRLNLSDAVWNIDYVRMDKNRSMSDTAVTDIAFTTDPTFLLNDYTSMPYNQFLANTAAETASGYTDSIHNATGSMAVVPYTFSAVALNTSTVLQAPTTSSAALGAYSVGSAAFPAYTTTIPSPGPDTRVVFENTYYLNSSGGTGSLANDTIVKDQVFDNYLAYDDGTAEQAYYLNLSATQPGEIAIEWHLNTPDTMRGMAIYFGRQIPDYYNELFNIVVYSSLAGINGAANDDTLLQEQLCIPGYIDTVNHFYIYRFSRPLLLASGTFYAGTVQPASFGSDSLYFGLDVNRIGANHAYYNVMGNWNPSLVQGAIMMRPLLGRDVVSSHVDNLKPVTEIWQAAPNPVKDELNFTFKGDSQAGYSITDLLGHVVMSGTVVNDGSVNVSNLSPGIYLANISINGVWGTPVKIVKL